VYVYVFYFFLFNFKQINDWLIQSGRGAWKDPGSNLIVGGCVYRDGHCDVQPWARGAHLYCSAQPSTIRGMVKWISAFGWVIVTNGDGYVDGSSLPADPQPKSVGLIWGMAARWVCIHQVNPVNSRNGSGRHDITIKMSRYCYYFFCSPAQSRRCENWARRAKLKWNVCNGGYSVTIVVKRDRISFL